MIFYWQEENKKHKTGGKIVFLLII